MLIEPDCIGTFFPRDAQALRAQVAKHLQAAPATLSPCRPKAIIVPHAGYDYSGPVAASAYACLAGRSEAIRRVVLLGTCHVVREAGLITTSADEFATPLGRVPVDKQAVELAAQLTQVTVLDEAHRADHALAVQLPWLQVTLQEFRVAPFLVAKCEPSEMAEVIELLWGGAETLIVVSSDLSHYLSYEEAQKRDRKTTAAIERLDATRLDRDSACGHRAISGLLSVARNHHARAVAVDIRNSADTMGDRSRVVGYGAFVFETTEESN